MDETLVFLICMLMYYKVSSQLCVNILGSSYLSLGSNVAITLLAGESNVKADAHDMPLWIPPRAYPFFLILYATKCLIFPWKQRKPLWIAIQQVIMAPFVSPTFFLTYVGDVFTRLVQPKNFDCTLSCNDAVLAHFPCSSMVKVFQDILWTICFVVYGDFLLSEEEHEEKHHVHEWTKDFWYKNVAIPLICLMPLWIRFNQCLRRYVDTGKRMPNLANAFKYALSQSVTLFGAFHPVRRSHLCHHLRKIAASAHTCSSSCSYT